MTWAACTPSAPHATHGWSLTLSRCAGEAGLIERRGARGGTLRNGVRLVSGVRFTPTPTTQQPPANGPLTRARSR